MPAKPKPLKTERPKLHYPTKQTLDKYGLSKRGFWTILESQGWICPVCKTYPKSGRWNIDHEHVKGWKKMPPKERKTYVRGITCWFCNRYYLAKQMSADKAKNVVNYLESYALRQKRVIR